MARPRQKGLVYNSHGVGFRSVVCPNCGKERLTRQDHKGKHCRSCSQKGELGYRWKGGRYINGFGYITVFIPDDSPYIPMASQRGSGTHYILEHRLVMAQKLGRLLDKREFVHHVNGDKTDNRPENLEVTNGNHNHKMKYKDAYDDGVRQGLAMRDKSLEQQIRLLQVQIKQLAESLKESTRGRYGV